MPKRAEATIREWLQEIDVEIGGVRPWDITVHHPDFFDRVLAKGSLGLGESYIDGWWDCDALDELIARALTAKLDERLRDWRRALLAMQSVLINLQSRSRAWEVGRAHYDLGSDFFAAMLGPTMAYSCGYWANATTLDEAQEAKLDLICRKLGLKPGMRLLDVGCGWGSLMRFAAERYGVTCVGITISQDQARFGQEQCRDLPVTFVLADYREFDPAAYGGPFDRVASVGMFEHVGVRNYPAFFRAVRRALKADGLFLLHTIGKRKPGRGVDPWIEKYIFPNGELPALSDIARAAEPLFVIEDVHNFGADYDKTLMAWYERFEAAWPRFAARYGKRFYRMWRYYLLVCAGTFRARDSQLWQIVLAPEGVSGGYCRVA
ncbi:MAG: cyclopropane fatty acyl phospholipid synthase [Hydrogenophilus thermoluteolus]|uniref:cyclopropane fatty acyl phospholipid synthase n=1 Tax=Hydrogenophilus thermoluteolus TaxID=297 RepID=UPI001C63F95F|nr:cyclopropane fatty acyl phospholipid synthase [Hydrogenophilus thermoluteolus]MBW7657313.1 cyclopropane fatty acyl phospholipid synthase [Hydrogenophilus thermoluteolus]